MSAFMMSNETLSMLADFIARYYKTEGRVFDFRFPDELYKELGPMAFDGEMVFHKLAHLNVKSLRNRYTDYEDLLGDIEYEPGNDIWANSVYDIEHGVKYMQPWHYQILKSLDCYLYQSCEGNCYKEPLYQAILSLRDKWGAYIAENQPQYTEADWK